MLVEYGERIGVAFQLADDLIDLASETGQSGKTPGTDLREGVPTLPVLLARASTDPADAELHELLDGDLTDDDRHAQALGPAAGAPVAGAGPGADRRLGRRGAGRALAAAGRAGARRPGRPGRRRRHPRRLSVLPAGRAAPSWPVRDRFRASITGSAGVRRG